MVKVDIPLHFQPVPKVRVRCKVGIPVGIGQERVDALELGVFHMPVPRVGEWIEPFRGWSACPVMALTWHIHRETNDDVVATVDLNPDWTGELRAELERRKAEASG